MAFLSSWIERPTQVAPNWRVCRFDPISTLFTPKWYEWAWYKISWENDMKWYIKWRDVCCNVWNAWCVTCVMCVICVLCMQCVQWNVWNVTWNDAKYNIKWREMMHEMTCRMQCMRCRSFISVTCNEMQPWIFDFGYMQRDVTLILDRDHNLIILFLILLRIWASMLM